MKWDLNKQRNQASSQHGLHDIFKDWIFSVYLYGCFPLVALLTWLLWVASSLPFVLTTIFAQLHTDDSNISACVCVCVYVKRERKNPNVTLTSRICSSGCCLDTTLHFEDPSKPNLKCNCPNCPPSYFVFQMVVSIQSPDQNLGIF